MSALALPPVVRRLLRAFLILLLLAPALLPGRAASAAARSAPINSPDDQSVPSLAAAEERFNQAIAHMLNTPADADPALQAALQQELEDAATLYELAKQTPQERSSAPYVYTTNAASPTGSAAAWTMVGTPQGDRDSFEAAFNAGLEGAEQSQTPPAAVSPQQSQPAPGPLPLALLAADPRPCSRVRFHVGNLRFDNPEDGDGSEGEINLDLRINGDLKEWNNGAYNGQNYGVDFNWDVDLNDGGTTFRFESGGYEEDTWPDGNESLSGLDVTFGSGQDWGLSGGSMHASGGDISYTVDYSVSCISPRFADLEASIVASPLSLPAGNHVTYQFKLRNNGRSGTNGASVTITLPNNLSNVIVNPSQGAGCTPSRPTFSCDLGGIGSGSTASVQVEADTPDNQTGTINASMSAAITDGGSTDPAGGNNSASAGITLLPHADTQVTVSGPALVQRNQTGATSFQVLVTATNNGQTYAPAVQLTPTLPGGVTVQAATPTSGSCQASGGCALGDLSVGASASVTYVLLVDPTVRENTTLNLSWAVAMTTGSPTEIDPTNNSVMYSSRLVFWDLSFGQSSPGAGIEVLQWINGTLYAGGAFGVRTWDGSAWSSLGSGEPNGAVYALVSDGAGGLYAGGSFSSPAANLAHWNGSNWSGVGASGTNGPVYALAFDAGVLYVGGQFSQIGGLATNNIARWEGGAWRKLGVAGVTQGIGIAQPQVRAILVDGNAVYVGGLFKVPGLNIARWERSSDAWTTLGSGITYQSGSSVVHALALFDGRVYAGGRFTSAGGAAASRIAAWDPAAVRWSTLGSGVGGSGSIAVNSLAATDSELLVGGAFTQAGAEPAKNVARWNGARWSTLGEGANGPVSSVAASAQTALVAGSFSTVNTIAVQGLARYHYGLRDLAISQTLLPDPPVAGAPLAIQLSVSNQSALPANGVVVRDELPVSASYVATSGASCVADGQIVTCDLGTLQASASTSFTINTTIATGGGGDFANRVRVGSIDYDTAPANNRITAGPALIAQADLSVALNGPATVTAGQALSYTLSVNNSGPADATGTLLTMTLPGGGARFRSAQGLSCTTPSDYTDFVEVICPVGMLATGATVNGTLSFTTTAESQGAINATLTASATQTDPAPSNNSVTVSTLATARADMQLTLDGPATIYLAPHVVAPYRYRLSATNPGPSLARAVTLTLTLPAATVFVAAPASCTSAGQTITCTPGDLEPGERIDLTLDVYVEAETPAGALLHASASLSAAAEDSDPSSNSATLDSTVITDRAQARLDLFMQQYAADTLIAGDTFVYTLEVGNRGALSSAVTVTDTLPANAVFDPSLSDPRCVDQPADPGMVVCRIADLTVGDVQALELAVQLPSATPSGTSVVNTATASGAMIEATPTDNTASRTATVAASADLELTLDSSHTSVAAGETITLTLAIINSGPSLAQSVVVSNPQPAGMILVSTSADQGSCTASAICTLGSLDAGASTQVQIVLIAGSGTVTDTATVHAATADPDLENNQASVSIEIASAERTTETFGAIDVTADTFVPLDDGSVQAFGNVWLGDTFYLAGTTDSVIIDEDAETLTGEGTLAYRQEQLLLFTGDFTGTLTSDEAVVYPAEDVDYRLAEVSGFHLADVFIASADLVSGRTSSPSGELEVQTEGFSQTLTVNLFIDPGPEFGGTVEEFEFEVGGISFAVVGAELRTSGLSAVTVTMTLPDAWGGIVATVSDLSITSDGISIGGASAHIPLPDFNLAGDKLRITEGSVTLVYDGSDLILIGEATVELNLPGNQQSSRVTLSISSAGDFSAEIDALTLTLAGATLELEDIAVTNSGLSVGTGVLTLPASLNASTITITDISITSAGLKVGGGEVRLNLPDINIGDGSKVRFSDVVATLGIADGTYYFGIAATVQLRLPQNAQDIAVAARIDSTGEFSGSISAIELHIASATMRMQNIAFNNQGLAVALATIQLPQSLGGASGSLTDVRIGANGLSIGGGSVRIPFPDVKLGSANGFSVTGVTAELSIAADRSFKLTIAGTVQVKVRTVDASVKGSITVDSQGRMSGSIDSFSINISGLEVKITAAKVSNGELSVAEATMKTPSSWGGAEVAIYNLRISSAGVRIGGGRFVVPDIKVGSVSLGSLYGELREEGNGYIISLGGKFRVAGLGGPSCMLGVGATVYVTSGGSTVLDLTAFDTTQAAPQGVELRQVSVGLTGCRIPIASTGFYLTRVQGQLTLTGSQTVIDLGVTIANDGELVRGDADMRIQFNPWQIDFTGSITLFSIFKAAELKATARSGYFSAELRVNGVFLEGRASLTAWTTDGSFHMVGRATIALQFRKGSVWETCVPLVGCVSIPPFDLKIAELGAEFGEFHKGGGTVWGLKGWAEVLGFRAGFYINTDGDLDIGNVDGYNLITPPGLRLARTQAVSRSATALAELEPLERSTLEQLHINGDDVVVEHIVGTPTDLMFVVSGSGAVPQLSLIAPDGTIYTATFQAGDVRYLEAPVDGNTQRLFSVKNAASGTWQAVLSGGDDSYIFQTLGRATPPRLEQVSAVNSGRNSATVAWSLTTPAITTSLDVFVNPGAITTTHTITNSQGVAETQVVPLYGGRMLRSAVPTRRDGSRSQLSVDLSELPSGSYWIWLRADDERSPAIQVYAPQPVVVAHTWENSWTADVQVVAHPRGVDLAWSAHPNPDVDFYRLDVTNAAGVLERTLDTEQTAYGVDGLTPGEQYGITVVGIDRETGRTSRSERRTLIATGATFTLNAPSQVQIVAGASFTLPLTIQSASPSFTSVVRLEAATLPDGFDVTFDAPDGLVDSGSNGSRFGALVTTSASLVGGTYTLILAGQGEGVRSEQAVEVTVLEPRIETSAAPTTIMFDAGGQSAAVGLSAVGLYGKTGSVDLDLLDAPAGLLYSFSQSSLGIDGTTTLLLTDTDRLRNGTYTLRIRAEAGLQQQFIPLTLTVNTPQFDLKADYQRMSIVAGEKAVFPITVPGMNIDGSVELSLDPRSTPVDAGRVGFAARASRSPQPTLSAAVNSTAYLIVDTQRALAPGIYHLVVRGTNGAIQSRLAFDLTVLAKASGVDLALTQTAAGTSVAIGGLITYTLDVINYGPLPATSVALTSTLPVLGTAVQAQASRGSCAISSGQVVCDLYTLRRGARAQVTIVTRIDPALEPYTDMVSSAAVSAAEVERNPADNTSLLTLPSRSESDLAVSVATEQASAAPGSAVTYRVVAWNQGPSVARQTSFTIELPDALTLLALDGAGAICEPSVDQHAITCRVDQLELNASRVVTLRTSVSAAARQPALVTATISGPVTDQQQANNVASNELLLAPDVRLSLTHLAVAPEQPVAGESITYQLQATNTGISEAQQVVLHDQLPAGLISVDSVQSSQGACGQLSGQIVCQLGRLAPGASAIVEIRGTVDPALRSILLNAATVESDAPESDVKDNTTIIETAVMVQADLQLTISSLRPTAFLYTVSNLGGSNSRGATLTGLLPLGVVLAQLVPSSGRCTQDGPRFTCELGPIEARGQATVNVLTKLPPQTLRTKAEGSVSGPEYDPRSANNTAATTSSFELTQIYMPLLMR